MCNPGPASEHEHALEGELGAVGRPGALVNLGMDGCPGLWPNGPMSYDFGGCDRELEELGGGLDPDLRALVAAHAPASVTDFTAVDAALDALGEVPEDLRAGVAASAPSAAPHVESPRDPESGEFSLGQPVEQGHGPDGPDASGELPLSSGERSGSYQLPEMEDDGAATDPSSAMEEALHTQHPDAPDAPDTEQVDLSQQPDVPDTVEEPLDPPSSSGDVPAPVSASQQVAPEKPGPEITQVVPTEPKTAIEASEEEIARADAADDEFDALFDELTSPSNAPPPPAEEQGLCADDELDGSVTTPPNVEEDLARLSQQDVPAVHDDDDDEATEIFDAASFAEVLETAQAVQGAPAPIADEDVEELDVEELDADELELMLEEDDGQDDEATTLPPDKKQRQAAAADDDAEGESDAGDSPSGLLRRLWGRKSKK